VILYLSVLSNCVSVSSNFNTAFLPDCTKSCSVFSRLLDRKFNKDSKNVLKRVIFSLQVGLTVNFVSDCLFKLGFCQFNFDTAFLPDCTKSCSVFWGYWVGNLMHILKMCLKGHFLTPSRFNSQCCLSLSFQTVFLPVQTLTPIFSLTVTNLVVFSLDYWIGNLMRILKMCFKQSFSHFKWVLQPILSLTVLSNCVS